MRALARRALSAMALLAAACGRGTERRPSTLTILYPGDERVLGPSWAMPAKFLVFLPLVTHDADGEVVGALARSWEHSADYRTWTVRLRSDVQWHDGMPFTARDVAFTEALWAHPDVANVPPGARTVTVLDDTTFVITFARPQEHLSTWQVYYPRHSLAELDPRDYHDWAFWVRPVGNGPYRYVRHVEKTLLELEANPTYFRGRPSIDRLVLRFGRSELTELISGRADVMGNVSPTLVPKLRRDPRFAVYHFLWPEVSWLDAIYWNHRDPLFADARVRRALTMGLNRAELRGLLLLPDDLPIMDVPFSGRQYRRGQLPAPVPFDLEGARRLLDEAGWRDSDGNGVRERAGVEFRFVALAASSGMDEGAASPAVYVQAALRQIGVRMDVQPLATGVVRRRLRAGEFQAAFGGFLNWITAGDPPQWSGTDGWTGYANPQALALLDSLTAVADPDVRDAIFRALAPILLEDLPVTLLFPQIQTVVAHRRVKGLASPFRADPVMSAAYLWIDQ